MNFHVYCQIVNYLYRRNCGDCLNVSHQWISAEIPKVFLSKFGNFLLLGNEFFKINRLDFAFKLSRAKWFCFFLFGCLPFIAFVFYVRATKIKKQRRIILINEFFSFWFHCARQCVFLANSMLFLGVVKLVFLAFLNSIAHEVIDRCFCLCML